MRLVRIITDRVTGEGLYAIRFTAGRPDEFERLFDLWIRDTDYLYRFFQDQKSEIQSGIYKGISVEQAVKATRKEAKFLQQTMLSLARNGTSGRQQVLQNIFQPLNNNEYTLKPLQKSKARGNREKRWLRIYAIRFAANCFVVTGGAIKLTLNMEALYLQEELQKLERVRQFLVDNDLRDQTDFEYLEI
jgi:hypothetical protein